MDAVQFDNMVDQICLDMIEIGLISPSLIADDILTLRSIVREACGDAATILLNEAPDLGTVSIMIEQNISTISDCDMDIVTLIELTAQTKIYQIYRSVLMTA